MIKEYFYMMENVIKNILFVVYKDGFVTKEFSLDELQSGVVTLDAIIEPIDVVVTETEVILNLFTLTITSNSCKELRN
jgi:hypothetical protein